MSRWRSRVIDRPLLVAFGANLGDPPAMLAWVAEEFDAAAGVEAVSRAYWTQPVGGPADQPPYLNAVFRLQRPSRWVDAQACLSDLQALERKAGRDRRVRWAARTLDLDLLDGFSPSEAPEATVPHPRMMERAFVLRPLLDVAPDWVHPVTGVAARSVLADLPGLGVTAHDGRAEGPL